jgi:hypothetical protein
MPLSETDHLNLIAGQVGQIVGGPAPSDAYFNSLVQSIVTGSPSLLSIWYTMATAAVLPDTNGNYTFSKVELIDLITRRLALLSLLGPLQAKTNQTLDNWLRIEARGRWENVQEGVKLCDEEIAECRRRIRDSRVPVLAEILRLSPVRADMPAFKPGPGQPTTTLPIGIDPNDDAWRGSVLYDSDDPRQPCYPGPLADQPGQPEGF